MTDKEAYEICKQAIKYIALKYSDYKDKNIGSITEQLCEQIKEETDINIMIEAIEKQIPKKPEGKGYGYLDNKCPICGSDVYAELEYGGEKYYDYCPDCGQKLEW